MPQAGGVGILDAMDKKIRSLLNMQNTVTGLLDEYDDVLTADADLAAAEQLRQVQLGMVRAQGRAADTDTVPKTENKETTKAQVIRNVLKPLGRVHAWADRTGNALMKAEAGVDFTTLDRIPDAEIIGRLESLMTLMRGVIAQIPTVPTATLDGLDTEIDGLEPLLGVARSTIVDRKAAGEARDRALKAARQVLENQHDKIVRSFEIANPATPAEQRQRDLFDRWDAARNIVDAPSPSPEPAAATAGAAAVPAK